MVSPFQIRPVPDKYSADPADMAKQYEDCGVTRLHVVDLDGAKAKRPCNLAVLEKIAGADVMMMPVGGTYTVDAQGAKVIIERAKPACVIPMHVKTKRCPYPIVPMHQALAALGAADAKPCDVLTVDMGNLPSGVALMQPAADQL